MSLLQRRLLAAAIGLYAAPGLIGGALMGWAIPAVNPAGMAWYALLWPGFVAEANLHTPGPPIPDWCFTFPAPAQPTTPKEPRA